MLITISVKIKKSVSYEDMDCYKWSYEISQ